jgi:hypothetical protein
MDILDLSADKYMLLAGLSVAVKTSPAETSQTPVVIVNPMYVLLDERVEQTSVPFFNTVTRGLHDTELTVGHP